MFTFIVQILGFHSARNFFKKQLFFLYEYATEQFYSLSDGILFDLPCVFIPFLSHPLLFFALDGDILYQIYQVLFLNCKRITYINSSNSDQDIANKDKCINKCGILIYCALSCSYKVELKS